MKNSILGPQRLCRAAAQSIELIRPAYQFRNRLAIRKQQREAHLDSLQLLMDSIGGNERFSG